MRTTRQIGPRIDERLYKELKNYCAESGISMSLVVEFALKEYLRGQVEEL
jgi:antitoxin component of RelBE/YafQ-DinJ toxin-antitoxin module